MEIVSTSNVALHDSNVYFFYQEQKNEHEFYSNNNIKYFSFVPDYLTYSFKIKITKSQGL